MKKIYFNTIIKFYSFFLKPVYKKIVLLFTPNIFGYKKKAYGQYGLGRYILPFELLDRFENPILLSFGVDTDISFEQDFLKQLPQTKVYCFDPSIDALPEDDKRITFYKLGISGRNIKSKNLLTITDILEKIQIKKPSTLFVKMDVEGWEWGFLRKNNLKELNIEIFITELHFNIFNFYTVLYYPFSLMKRYKALKRLTNDYYVFHTHANNISYTKFKDFIFPNLVEITLISKKLFEQQIINEINEFTFAFAADNENLQYPFILK